MKWRSTRSRVLAYLTGFTCTTGLLITLPSAATPALAADNYLGAVSQGRGTILGTASYTPPPGALYVSSSAGSDSNAGTVDRPLKTVARALQLVPSGGTIVLRAGIYHEAVTVSKSITIQNSPREVVWFDGSSAVSNWSKSGSVWTAPWTTFFAPVNFPGGVQSSYPYANYPAQVFINGDALTQVGSASAVTTGTFFADSANKRLVIGSDPSGKSVVSSDLTRPLYITAANVNLLGFGVRRYASSSANMGAIVMDPSGGRFENLVVSDNADIGIAMSGGNKTFRNLTVERNGMMGIGLNRADNLVLDSSLVRDNNTENFPSQPIASGVKVTTAVNARITNNTISDSIGANGLWLDEYCSNAVVTGNTVTGSGYGSIVNEMGSGGIIANNIVNGGRTGIDLRDTDSVKVMNNHISGYTKMGVLFSQDDRWVNRPSKAPSSFQLLLKDIVFANNVLACGTRFQIYGEDPATKIPTSDFDLTITGNLLSSKQSSPELNLAGWWSGSKVEFLQTAEDLAAKGSQWKNLQATVCNSSPEDSVTEAALVGIATPLPADVAAATGASTGAKIVGLIGSSVSPTALATPTQTAAPVANVAPVAAFSSSVSGLKVSVDGSGSSDSDGTVASYAWDFGDGSSGTGQTVSHTYSVAGTYTVKLAVTDNQGATSALVSHSVTVAVASGAILASDAFGRTASSSWGTSDVGGAWTLSGGSAAFSVASGKGVITLSPSYSRDARLSGVTSTATVSEVTVSTDEAAAGAVPHVTLLGRVVGSSSYGARLRFEIGGALRLYILKDETALASSYVLSGVTYSPGDSIHVKVEVSGTSPTTVRARAWVDGASEPSSWQLSATDNTSAMQVAGTIGIKAAVGSASTNTATHIRVDDYVVKTP